MRKILLTTLVSFFTFTAISQEGIDEIVGIHSIIAGDGVVAGTSAEAMYWKYAGNFSFTFSQVSLTNWAAGGDNAISGNAGALFKLKYQRDKMKWENTLDLGYGLTKQGDDPEIKNEDKIDFSSQFGRRASEKWFYSGLLGFKTQFDKGFKNPGDSLAISNSLHQHTY